MKIEKTELKGIFVKELSGEQLIEFLEYVQTLGELTPAKNLEVACMLISMGACDKDGNPHYTPEKAKKLPWREIQLLSSKVIEVSGMGETNNLKNALKDSSTTS